MKKALLTALIAASLTVAASCGAPANIPAADNVPTPGLSVSTSDGTDQTAPDTAVEEPIEGTVTVVSGSPEATAAPKPYEPPVLDELPEDIGYSEGRFLLSSNGSAMILIDNYGPCSMSRAEASVSFDGLTDGDLIRVGYQIVMESYPGQMPVYTVEKLADGEFEDLDQSTLAKLAGMGWIDAARILGDIKYIRTDGYNEIIDYPMLVKITSRGELDRYVEAYKDIFYLGSRETVYSDTTVGFADAIIGYDDAYFAENELWLAVLEEGSGSIRHEFKGITGGFLNIDSTAPEVCTDDMAEWHIIVEAPIGMELWGINEIPGCFTADEAIALVK